MRTGLHYFCTMKICQQKFSWRFEKTLISQISQCFGKTNRESEFLTYAFSERRTFKKTWSNIFKWTLQISINSGLKSLAKLRGHFAHERGVTLLKSYLSEIEFEISAILFCKITYLSILRSIRDTILSVLEKDNVIHTLVFY